MGYDAFVSYSHAADGRLAPALQRGMQRLARPWFRLRALAVFRDESALAANPHLWSSIQAALDDSQWFVLLASPDAAQSWWVNRELEYWLAHKPVDRVLPVVTDGTWAWDGRGLSGTAVLAALRLAFSDEPRHVDLRWAHDAGDVELRNNRFRDAVAQLAAPIHGIPKDELESEDVRLQRRARRVARAAVVTLALLTAIAAVFGTFAARERNRAEHQATVADARGLAAEARNLANGHLDLALLLAVEARRLDNSVAPRGALEAVLSHGARLERFVQLGANTASTVSGDGRLVAVGHSDGSIELRDLASGRVARTFADGTTSVTHMAFSADGRTLAVSHQDGTIDLREVATGIGQSLGGRADGYWSGLAFSPDGRRLAAADLRGQVAVWNLKSAPGAPTVLGPRNRPVNGLAWGPNSRTLTVEDATEGRIATWDVATRQRARQITVASIATTAVALGPDGHTLAIGQFDGRIELFDLATGRVSGSPLGEPGPSVAWLVFSPDGATLAAATSAGTVTQWDLAKGRPRGQPLVGVGADTFAGVVAGDRLVTLGPHTAGVWRLTTIGPALGRLVARFPGSPAGVFLSSDGSLAFMSAIGADHWVLFDMTRGRILATYPKTTSFYSAAWSPDATTFAMGGADGRIRLIDPRTGADLGLFDGLRGIVYAVAFSPDGRTIAGGGADGTVVLWDVASHRRLGPPFRGGGGLVEGVAFSPDGKTLAITAAGGTAVIYDVATHRALHTFDAHEPLYRIAFTPDGKTMAVGTDNAETLLIDPHTGRAIGEPLAGHSGRVLDVDFSRNGTTLATASFDGTVILFDVASRQPIGDPLDAGYGAADIGRLTPDGHTLASSYLQGQIVIWDTDPDAWQQRACATAGRNLTHDEWHEYLGTRPYHKTCPQWPAGP